VLRPLPQRLKRSDVIMERRILRHGFQVVSLIKVASSEAAC
jgi:hypothetical protein